MRRSAGSALILAVVLTSLLAVIAVAFLLSSRMDSIATSAVAENKELGFAVDTVIAKISNELVADTPGITADEYYDYPDACNPWLASLEPYQLAANDYRWMRITDLYGFLELLRRGGYLDRDDYPVDPNNLKARLWADSAPVTGAHQPPVFTDTVDFGGPADADGDGVADSRWIRLPNITSGKGKPIYAAIRIIDNSAMLNVNTAYRFDPNTAALADGSSQMQINLLALAGHPSVPGSYQPALDANNLLTARAGAADPNLYAQNVIWSYGNPIGPYTPFDISDELELRYRFLVNQQYIDTRAELLGAGAWDFRTTRDFKTPATDLGEWRRTACAPTLFIDPNYSYRHIATINNMDRVIDPNGRKMFNVNTVDLMDPCDVYLRTRNALLDGRPFVPALHAAVDSNAAQIAANLIDYRDADDDVSVVYDYANIPHFGFETPCVYISELVQAFRRQDPNDPNSTVLRAFAIELYKPYFKDAIPVDGRWRLLIAGYPPIQIHWSGSNRFHVMVDDPSSLLNVNFSDVNAPNDINEPNRVPQNFTVDSNLLVPGTILQLNRFVPDANTWLTVDTAIIPDFNTGWPDPNTLAMGSYSYQRDITLHKCIRRLWDIALGVISPPTLGGPNAYVGPGPMLQAHPANARFTNVGQLGELFNVNAYAIGQTDTELNTRLNLADPRFQQIFKYFTVIDPAEHGAPTETRVKGRININTAPWFVLAQLPWVTPGLAQAIVTYRDTVKVPHGYGSIGELMQVVSADPCSSIDAYARDSNDILSLPDLTPNDHAINDFEERDVIFARISNLVTVRSDVFTAYILVRIGRDGPQKRVVAILDRSGVKTPADKVRVIALHPVEDPR